MSKKPVPIVVEEKFTFSLQEICDGCGIPVEYIIEMVDYGILEPQGKTPEQWQFPNNALELSRRAVRLQKDFDLNTSGIALTLELLEEVNSLRSRVSQLERYLQFFEDEKH